MKRTIANQNSFVRTDYLKISFNTSILLYMLFFIIKYMHSMIVSGVHFLQEMCSHI